MRARSYGLLVLILAGIVPLGVYGLLAIDRSEDTSIAQIRRGNDDLAGNLANSIYSFIKQEQQLIASLGVALIEAGDDRRARELADAFMVQHIDLDPIVVYDRDAQLIVGAPPPEQRAVYREVVRDVLTNAPHACRRQGATPRGQGRQDRGCWEFRVGASAELRTPHSLLMAVPIVIAGAVEGVILVSYTLTRMWPMIARIRVERTGFVRLLGPGEVLLAHGQLDELRDGFSGDPAKNRELLAAAHGGHTTRNARGQEVVVAAASIDQLKWTVLIEQTVEEAFASTQQMKRDLLVFAALVLLVVITVGLAFGRVLVRALERLRAHTQVLAQGRLAVRADVDTKLVEVRALAESLNDMADSLDEMQEQARARERLSTFARVAAGLAHDLRLPIEAVRGACEMIRAEPTDPYARDLLLTISGRELPRLKRYVDDLQRLARDGDLALEHEVVDPGQLAHEAVEELSDSPKWSGVTFEVTGEATPTLIDRGLIRRAILNLAGNGADACLEKLGEGTVTIDVSDRDDGQALVIRVIDTGVGMPEDRAATLLRGDFRSTKRATGVGLGLGVASQVAAAHRGTLTVTSRLGEGSTFELSIPRGDSYSQRGAECATVQPN